MSEVPGLFGASFRFGQDGNTAGTTEIWEQLEVILEIQVGEDDLPFIVLKTDGWSIDEPSDLGKLLESCLSVWRVLAKEAK